MADCGRRAPRRARGRLPELVLIRLPSLLVVLVFALVCALLFGFMSWLLGDVWNLPLAAATDVTPRSVYRKDIQTSATSGLVFGFTGGLLAGLITLIVGMFDAGRSEGFVLVETVQVTLFAAVIVGLMGGLVGGLRNGATPLLLGTEASFALRGQPVRFIPLLESARERQVLRQAGAVYQFRHADLQDRLADRYRQKHT